MDSQIAGLISTHFGVYACKRFQLNQKAGIKKYGILWIKKAFKKRMKIDLEKGENLNTFCGR